MKLFCSKFTMPGADLPRENPLPRFRDQNHDQTLVSDGTLSGDELVGLGLHTGFRVLPYCMQDAYTLERSVREYETVVLENSRLRATFIPSLGGRLWSLFDKEKGRELIYRNPVFQPANLAIRDAWFSGGIEWNMAQLGHTYSTCDSVFCARMEQEGEVFLRMYDYVRTTGIFWQIDFHLPEGADCLYAHVRMVNDGDKPVPLYWWTNIAVPQEKKLRIFSGTREVIYINPNTLQKENAVHGYGHAQLPELPSMPGVDVTYPENSTYTNEFFFQNGKEQPCPWEAAAYDDGFVFMERSTQPLRIRKMFCWGSHSGGHNWQDRLSRPGEGNYVEIQAGLSPTQVHGEDFAPGSVVEFTQAFGSMEMDPGVTHGGDWLAARPLVEAAVEGAIPGSNLAEAHVRFCRDALLPCGKILSRGHGWGALENLRRSMADEKTVPDTVCFPGETMGAEEKMWAVLLTKGILPPLRADQLPRSWMTDETWEAPLRAALRDHPEHTALRVHLGTLLYENGREEEAAIHWRAAGEQAAALRNLSVFHQRRGEPDQARDCLARAFRLNAGRELAGEYLELLAQNEAYETLWQAYQSLSQDVAADERVMISAAAAAFALGHDEFLDRVFAYPFAVIREGETKLTDLWFRREAAREGARTGRQDLDAVEQELRQRIRPPKNIDYRLTNR